MKRRRRCERDVVAPNTDKETQATELESILVHVQSREQSDSVVSKVNAKSGQSICKG